MHRGRMSSPGNSFGGGRARFICPLGWRRLLDCGRRHAHRSRPAIRSGHHLGNRRRLFGDGAFGEQGVARSRPENASENRARCQGLSPGAFARLFAGATIQRRPLLGNLDHALQDYDASLQLDPYAANHYNNRGVIYRIKGDLVRAVEEYGKAIVLKPDYIAAYYNRALAYREMGQFDNALTDFNSALRINPYNEYALYQRGLLKQKMGDMQGAAVDIAVAKSTNPEIAKEFEHPPTE
jgi:tetratricopeptide (TPR) repeat protein